MNQSNVITLCAREVTLKRKIRMHLREIGFQKAPDGSLLPPNLDKETYRNIHAHQREEKFEAHKTWLAKKSSKLIGYFASGKDVEVSKIEPRLEVIYGDSWQSDLFRFAGLYWRIPISNGYGRRLRFLVWDDNNEKLIGLLALGDAVFNLKVRDEVIGWDHERRADALVNMMDAYVLGAVPPYNFLLGGKLIASLLRTVEIVKAFSEKYQESIGVISRQKKHAQLAAITTSSALGRSSIYNRLKLDGRLILEPIGYTSGWGHFHFSDELFEEMREYLKRKADRYANAHNFGNGPNWRIRVIRRTLSLLGMDPDLARHGFTREVFFCPVANNAVAFLRGDDQCLRYDGLLGVKSASRLALERWVIPRAARTSDHVAWRSDQFLTEIKGRATQLGELAVRSVWTGRETS